MKDYAAGYGNYADYETYIKRYSKKGSDTVASAEDAQNKTQLREWRAGAKQNVARYIPNQYGKYADREIDKKYAQRLDELEHPNRNTTQTQKHDDSTLALPPAVVELL